MQSLRLVCLCMVLGSYGSWASASEPDFNRDVRPILSDKCFACHGQDAQQRQADLRLDVALASGSGVVVPGRPQDSELIRRINSVDPEAVMPPTNSHKQLTPDEKQILAEWIKAGGQYARHWAFAPPAKQPVPLEQNAIDFFVQQQLHAKGWTLSPPAAPATWLRRVSLDLTGLPPTAETLDQFLKSEQEQGEAAYEAVVDRLLASPRFGERMTQEWLDVARYADTHGFNNDSARTMWRWRDWVIDAFNTNMPYDQFITEQLAGDLLPDATLEQRIATGFCRNHVINSEGGIIEEEYRVEYVADRVRTLSTAWLGLTMECVRCHDHKFDPLTQVDYYSLFAFFNNVPEHGEDGRIANAVPMIPAPTRPQQEELAERRKALNKIDEALATIRQPLLDALRQSSLSDAGVVSASEWLDREQTAGDQPTQAVQVPEPKLVIDFDSDQPEDKVWKLLNAPKLVPGVIGQAWRMGQHGPAAEIVAGRIDFGKRGTVSLWIKPDLDCPNDVAILSSVNYVGNSSAQGFAKGHEIRLVDGELEVRTNDTFPAYAIRLRTEGAKIVAGQWRHLSIVMGGTKKAVNIQVLIDGQPQLVHTSHDGLSGDNVAGNATYNLGAERTADAPNFRGLVDQLRFYDSELNSDQIQQLFRPVAVRYARQRVASQQANVREQQWLVDHHLLVSQPEFAELTQRRRQLWTEYLQLYRNLPTTMVMQELAQPRPTYVLKRGAYDAPGQPVVAGVPEELLGPWPADAPRNRLGLAKWLTGPDHPLVARVVVNRWWAMLFGSGLVRTLEDFGYQGEYPSHPQLLDWIARDFIESGWDTKRCLRYIVLSKTYRQSSPVTPQLLSDDPENRLLARAPRIRLTAEMLRDQALAISGLLKERIGGPSVYPYQPDGLYDGLVVGADYPGTTWPTSQGDDLYRRTMYTFVKRTVPHPLMQTFDAPDREFCTARRSRTNTPLQALVLMNEPGFYEAARALGTRIQNEGGADDRAKLTWAVKQVLSRAPHAAELQLLIDTWQAARATDPATANTLLASILLNLDECVTRP